MEQLVCIKPSYHVSFRFWEGAGEYMLYEKDEFKRKIRIEGDKRWPADLEINVVWGLLYDETKNYNIARTKIKEIII